MRKTLLAMATLPWLLAGCASTPSDLATIVAQVQAYTTLTCAFQPTLASVSAIIAAMYPAGIPVITAVNEIGNAICSAPTTQSVRRRGAVQVTKIVPTPRGPVAVHGNYVGAR